MTENSIDTSSANSPSNRFEVWVLKETQAKEWMEKISTSFSMDKSQLQALIIRESSGDARAKSISWSKWLMQLTGNVFDDMDTRDKTGRGMRWYQSNFQKIGDDLISNLSQMTDSRTNTQGLANCLALLKSTSNSKEFNTQVKTLKSIVANEFQKWGYIANLIVGSIYLDALNNSQTKERMRKGITRELSKVTPTILNQLLLSKKFDGVDSAKLEDIKTSISSDSKKYEEFYQLYMYNGDINKTWWIEHRVLYALAVMASTEQIREETKSKLADLRSEISKENEEALG
jgi:hypothetical protein